MVGVYKTGYGVI